jgi:tetratricopeptide (TPR) repeat protein
MRLAAMTHRLAHRRFASWASGLLIAVAWVPVATAADLRPECGVLDNPMGPFDYTNLNDRTNLTIVENAHFTREVEALKGHNKCGGNGCQLRADLDYTLRAFPNHHRALLAVVNYNLRRMDDMYGKLARTASCYFERALYFKPEDPTVHMIFGYYLSSVGDSARALEEYQTALELAPHSAEVHYNLGLLYADRGEYPQARDHAVRAYELGYPLPGLRAKLQRAGQWIDADDTD